MSEKSWPTRLRPIKANVHPACASCCAVDKPCGSCPGRIDVDLSGRRVVAHAALAYPYGESGRRAIVALATKLRACGSRYEPTEDEGSTPC